PDLGSGPRRSRPSSRSPPSRTPELRGTGTPARPAHGTSPPPAAGGGDVLSRSADHHEDSGVVAVGVLPGPGEGAGRTHHRQARFDVVLLGDQDRKSTRL